MLVRDARGSERVHDDHYMPVTVLGSSLVGGDLVFDLAKKRHLVLIFDASCYLGWSSNLFWLAELS